MKNNEIKIQKIIMKARQGFIEIKENREINRLVGCKGVKKRSLLWKRKDGYLTACINDNGKNYTAFAHRITWTYFKGRIPEGITINHIDGNKENNTIKNLELATQKEQTYHAM